jgi:hypothetical protein
MQRTSRRWAPRAPGRTADRNQHRIAAAKRKLRLALAGAQSPREAAREITKRLTSIARARSFINWKNRKPLVTISKPSAAPSSSRSHRPILTRRWR